jgi:hypothetical protein
MLKYKKSQLESEVFKYVLVAIVAGLVIILGYKAINLTSKNACDVELGEFIIGFQEFGKPIRQGNRELISQKVPCNVNMIFFLDSAKRTNPEDFDSLPLIKDSITSATDKNIFLINGAEIVDSFSLGDLRIEEPYYLCFNPVSEKISFYAERDGKTLILTYGEGQRQCTPKDLNN